MASFQNSSDDHLLFSTETQETGLEKVEGDIYEYIFWLNILFNVCPLIWYKWVLWVGNWQVKGNFACMTGQVTELKELFRFYYIQCKQCLIMNHV